MTMDSPIIVYNKINSCYSVVISALGTIGNLLALYVCLRKNLRKTPTFVFIAFVLPMDTLSLFFWNFNNFYLTYFNYLPVNNDLETCKILSFLQMFSLQASAYLLVAMSVERYLSVKVKNWRNAIFKPKHAALLSAAIVLFFFIFNFHLNFTLTFQKKIGNKTNANPCTSTSIYVLWRNVHTYIFAIVSFTILALFNILLLYHVLHRSKIRVGAISLNRSDTKRKSMTISVVIITFAFIIMNAPHAIAGGYYLQQLLATEYGRATLYSMSALLFTYHAANFIVLMLSNKQFNKEVKIICYGSSNDEVTNTGFGKTNSKLDDRRS